MMNPSRKQLSVLAVFLLAVAVVAFAVVKHSAGPETPHCVRFQLDPEKGEITFSPADGMSFSSISFTNGTLPLPAYGKDTRAVSFSLRDFFRETAGTQTSYLGIYFRVQSDDGTESDAILFRIYQDPEKRSVLVDTYPSGDEADPSGSTTETVPWKGYVTTESKKEESP